MSDKIELSRCYQVIFEALEKGYRIEQVVKYISEGIGLSIVILDPCGTVLAQEYVSSDSPDKGYFEESKKLWMQMIKKYYAKERVSGEDNPFSQTEVWGQGIVAMSPILVKDNMEGFCITYHEEHDMVEDICEMNRLICRGVAVNTRRGSTIYSSVGSATKQAISKILLGRREELADVPEISEEVYDTYAGGGLVLGILKIEKKYSCTYVQQLRNQISNIFPDVLTYLQDRELWILFTHVGKSTCHDIYGELEKILENTGCICGISELFYTRDQIEVKKKIMRRIIQIGRQNEKDGFIFTEYQYYLELICSYAYDEIGDQGYCSYNLEKLEMEDKEKGTEFYRTLKEYLLSGNSVNLAAKKLFIHRNTMVYRLSKIHELMAVDINNPEVAKRLLVNMILRSFRAHEN